MTEYLTIVPRIFSSLWKLNWFKERKKNNFKVQHKAY